MSVVRSKIESLLSDENVVALLHEFQLIPACIVTPSFARLIREEYLERWFNQLREEEEREEMYAFLEFFIKKGKSRLESVELSGTLFPSD